MKTSLVFTLVSLSLAAGLAACGKQEPAAPASAPAPVTTPAPAPAPAAEPATPAPTAAANPVGASVYAKTCALCHAAGVGGAPKPGDKADWGPRIAQGEEVLFKHALEGFTGAKGMMPAKGGAASLSDEDVKAAVTHMVSLSR
ncbi:cytochrome c5 family protein [Ideonella sp.]|uniref:c-type cytochrome n=1 Tax=Ideonella sp. TaxID=1929293 RepID=UPI0035B27A92